MNYDDSPEVSEFRTQLRAWLAEHKVEIPAHADEATRADISHAWHRSLYEGGWLGLTWPVEFGGRGLTPIFEGVLNEELARADAPPPPGNIGYLAKAIMGFATTEQQARYIPSLLKGEERWCQGFSEPGAGSDLAALRTRADLDGDEYIVNGQKVWTSGARWAHWCLVLARTDQSVAKHKGISAVIVKMDAPGVTVRPLYQIDHNTSLAEVFFDNVRVPKENLIGRPGDGWNLAMRTLAYERGPAEIGAIARGQRQLYEIEDAAAAGQYGESASTRAMLARLYVQWEVLRLQVQRSLSTQLRAGTPGPEGSVDKLIMVKAEQDLHRVAMELEGAAPTVGDGDDALNEYLHSRAISIYGGAAQIQKNIIAQRVLGMPRV
jgi:alkylation response protein AidB-like acyl-CoA dehydrogenase